MAHPTEAQDIKTWLEHFQPKQGCEELSKRVSALSDRDIAGMMFTVIGAYSAGTYAEWAKFKGIIEEHLSRFEGYGK